MKRSLLKKWIFFFVFNSLLIFIIISQHKLILSEYAKFFTINDAKPGADAILILSGGKNTRIPHALNLFLEGYGKELIFTEEKKTNSFISNLFPSDENIFEKLIEKLNISVPFIFVPSNKGGATSTFDEAYDFKKLADGKNYNRIILVTDAFHTRRALKAFKKVFKNSKIHFQMSPAQNEIFDENNWWTSDQGISAYILETIKYPIYFFSSSNFNYIRND